MKKSIFKKLTAIAACMAVGMTGIVSAVGMSASAKEEPMGMYVEKIGDLQSIQSLSPATGVYVNQSDYSSFIYFNNNVCYLERVYSTLLSKWVRGTSPLGNPFNNDENSYFVAPLNGTFLTSDNYMTYINSSYTINPNATWTVESLGWEDTVEGTLYAHKNSLNVIQYYEIVIAENTIREQRFIQSH